MLTARIILISLAVLALTALGGSILYTYRQNERLKQQNTELRTTVDALSSRIDLINRTVAAYQEARNEREMLNKTLSGGRLGKVVRNKPGLTAGIINRGTQRVFDELEQAINTMPAAADRSGADATR